MKSSSLSMIDAGIPEPRVYRDAIIHDWTLREEFQKHLKIYIIRETTAAQFFYNFKDGELKVRGKSYSVIWHNSPTAIRESKNPVIVSLRYCPFLDRGYALVKILKDGQFQQLEF